MVGATLSDIRQYIESVACEAGEYTLLCARTGQRPVPAAGLTFETRPTARAAARATEQYRATLRRYDPHLPFYDVIVHQRSAPSRSGDGRGCPAPEGAADAPTRAAESSLIEFCHTVAGAVFEAVADSPHEAVETAILDTYTAVAEPIDDPDALCLRLLDSMAAELDRELDRGEQLAIVRSAARRLPARGSADDPLVASLEQLRSAALVQGYSVRPRTVDGGGQSRSWEVTIDEYALGRSADRVVTLPLVLGLLRGHPACDPAVSTAERVTDRTPARLRMQVTTAPDRSPDGLVSVAATSGE